MYRAELEQRHLDAIDLLIDRITADVGQVPELVEAFQHSLQAQIEEQEQSQDEWDDEGPQISLLGAVAQACDREATFHVDWEDPESLADVLGELAERWGETLDFDDTPTDPTAGELLRSAQEQLIPAHLGLWTWETENDAVSGWIGRLSDAALFEQIGEVLGVRIAPVDEET